MNRFSKDKGASLVEYALGLGLALVLLIGAVEALQAATEDDFDERSESISDPGDVGGPPPTQPGGSTTSTAPVGSSTTFPSSTSSTSTSLSSGPQMEAPSCTMSTGNKLDCKFLVTGAAQGSSFDWSVTFNGAAAAKQDAEPFLASATSDSFTTNLKKSGTYVISVVVKPSNQTTSRSVTCTGSGSNYSCS